MAVIVVTVAETSLEAYREKIENGTKKTDENKCFELIDDKGPITMKAMEMFMGKNKHKFSGRIRDLKDKDLVEKTGTKDGHQVLETVENSGVKRVDESGDKFVTISEADLEDEDGEPELFENDEKSKVCDGNEQKTGKVCNDKQHFEPGDVIYG